jgi:plastocyanin
MQAARRLLCTAACALQCLAAAHAATVTVTDSTGQPLADAVVYFEPVRGAKPAPSAAKPAMIEQIKRRFVPALTVVQTGTPVSFPNRDSVRHHVYSFSPTKSFELKLYAGTPSEPVVFDKPGTVVLGCNIHDQMVAYVHVVDTPFFAKTDAQGVGAVPGVPVGNYRLKVWHSALGIARPVPEKAVVVKGPDTGFAFTLDAAGAAR